MMTDYKINIGEQYWLDGTIRVSVLKAINRAKTFYSVSTGTSVLTVMKERLKDWSK